ncbi:hypothetical protein D3C85_853280 [compost metagenome]
MAHFMADHVDGTEVVERAAAVADVHALAAAVVVGVVVGRIDVGGDVGGRVVAVQAGPAQHILVRVVGVHQTPHRVHGRRLAVGVGGAAAVDVLLAVAPGIAGAAVHAARGGAVVGIRDGHAAEAAARAAAGVFHGVGAARERGVERHLAVVLAVADAGHGFQGLPLTQDAAILGADDGVIVDRLAAADHARLHQVGQLVVVDHVLHVKGVQRGFRFIFGTGHAHGFHDGVDQQLGMRRHVVDASHADVIHGGGDGGGGADGRRGVDIGGGAAGDGIDAAATEAGRAVRHGFADDVAGAVADHDRFGTEDGQALVGVLYAAHARAADARMLGADGKAMFGVQATAARLRGQLVDQAGGLLWRSQSDRGGHQGLWQRRGGVCRGGHQRQGGDGCGNYCQT